MPPLAKTFVESHGPLHNSHQLYAKPPPLTVSSSTGSSSSRPSSNTSSSTISKSSSTQKFPRSSKSGFVSPTDGQRQVKVATLTPFHGTKASVRAILVFLETNGVAKGSIQEMCQMEFVLALSRAEDFVECILFELCTEPQGDSNMDAIEMLFTSAWTKVVEYTRANAQKSRQAYSSHENKQHQELLAQQSLPERQQEARQRRRLREWDPKERQRLIDDVNQWTRAKIEAEKGMKLNKEWSRYIRTQQRRIHEYQKNRKNGPP